MSRNKEETCEDEFFLNPIDRLPFIIFVLYLLVCLWCCVLCVVDFCFAQFEVRSSQHSSIFNF